jgi:predicted glycogen debranching enzyme
MDDEREWLEADGLGGFAMGTVSGVRTRRYHALLLTATTPPTGRMVLVNGFDAWIETASGRYAISSQRYAGGNAGPGSNSGGAAGVVHPDGASRIESFTADPWPAWTFRLEDGTLVRQEIVIPHDRAAATVTWRLLEGGRGRDRSRDDAKGARLIVRPFLSGRDYHSTHHENGAVRTAARQDEMNGAVVWQPYDGVPAIVSRTGGSAGAGPSASARYEHQPDWYRRFFYTAEQERGLDDTEDLWSPGWLTWELASTDAEAVWHLEAGRETAPREATPRDDSAQKTTSADATADTTRVVRDIRDAERTRRAAMNAASPLHRAADAYLVRRGAGRTIIAGYPWFTDWGRDTFIALRGLCLATGRVDDAREILVEWSGAVSEGMLPNRFPDGGDRPEFNAVDASLWFIAAVQDYCDSVGRSSDDVDARERMMTAVQQILEGYARGTRYGIRLDDDGLLACGEPGVQLTWMDARIGDRVITPRTGKPVEIQALWLNALLTGASRDSRWKEIYERGRASFAARFWNDADGCLYDVVDVDHQAGRVDASCRPNQIFAVGGLAHALIDGERARRIVDTVERRLLTPLGLRSLAPGSPGYEPSYGGGPERRDAAYHQGTVWPWLMGAFVDAWLRVRDRNGDARAEERAEAQAEARDRFLAPLMRHLDEAGIGHVSEVASAEAPFMPGGCPFQAWSVGELIRISAMLTQRGVTRGVMRATSARKAGSSRSQRSSGSTGTNGIQPDRAS